MKGLADSMSLSFQYTIPTEVHQLLNLPGLTWLRRPVYGAQKMGPCKLGPFELS